MSKTTLILILLMVFYLSGCDSSLTTVGNPRGVPTEVTLTNDVDESEASTLAFVTVNTSNCHDDADACYTPPLATWGIRSFSLLRCLDTTNGNIDTACPGDTGEELNDFGNISLEEALLAETISNQILFEGTEALTIPTNFGNTEIIPTNNIEEAGLYSGFRVVFDFIMNQLPADLIDLNADFIFFCMNENGCSSLVGYPTIFDNLALGTTQEGDILFLRLSDSTWSFFDKDTEELVAISSGRPSNPMTQEIADSLLVTSSGAREYNASFGSALDPIEIEETDLDTDETLELTVVFSVENAMSFEDINDDALINTGEIETIVFGKPLISTFEIN